MPLVFSVKEVANWEQLCHRKVPGTDPEKCEWCPPTFVLTHMLGLHLGIPELRVDTYKEAYRRYVMFCQVCGGPIGVAMPREVEVSARTPKGTKKRKVIAELYCERLLTLKEFGQHVGMTTNGPRLTKRQFHSKLMNILKREGQQKLSGADYYPDKHDWVCLTRIKSPEDGEETVDVE